MDRPYLITVHTVGMGAYTLALQWVEEVTPARY